MTEVIGELKVSFGDGERDVATRQRDAGKVMADGFLRHMELAAGAIVGRLVGRLAGPGVGGAAGGLASGLIRQVIGASRQEGGLAARPGLLGIAARFAASPAGLATGIVGLSLYQLSRQFRRAAEVVGGFVSAVARFTSRMQQEVDRLARFSPTVALASMQQQVRQIFRDLGRAQMLGPGLLQQTMAVERFKDLVAAFRNSIDLVLLRVTSGFVNFANNFIAGLPVLFDVLGQSLAGVPGFGALGALLQAIGRNVKQLVDQGSSRDAAALAAGANSVFMRDLEAMTEGGRTYFVGRKPMVVRKPQGPMDLPPRRGEDWDPGRHVPLFP